MLMRKEGGGFERGEEEEEERAREEVIASDGEMGVSGAEGEGEGAV